MQSFADSSEQEGLLQDLADDRISEKARISYLKLRTDLLVSSTAPRIQTQAGRMAKSIKSNPLYRDPGVNDQSNWLSNALNRLRGLQWPHSKADDTEVRGAPGMGWIIPLMWAILTAALCAFLYLVFRHVSWTKLQRRKVAALLDDDEPVLTVDEWLSKADGLTAEGRYREAVRCLYLACLLRIDEAGIARFDRGHTNWEHLQRIESSLKRPGGLEFRGPTQAFDRIWYGFQGEGRADVDRFRATYEELLRLCRDAKGAQS